MMMIQKIKTLNFKKITKISLALAAVFAVITVAIFIFAAKAPTVTNGTVVVREGKRGGYRVFMKGDKDDTLKIFDTNAGAKGFKNQNLDGTEIKSDWEDGEMLASAEAYANHLRA